MTNTAITKAVNILELGGLVAFPTETVYGLGADASNAAAVEKIFRAKERPHNHPLIVHIASVAQLSDWAKDISDDVYQLAEQVWPGPLTLILKKQNTVLDLVTAHQDTIGLRIPNHPVALSLLKTFGRGIAAPSANRFTRISPTTAKAVQQELGNKVDYILDGGACDVGLESTIIDLSSEQPIILRLGMMSAEKLSNMLKKNVLMKMNSHVRAPGMHHVHYAPTTKTTIIHSNNLSHVVAKLSNQSIAVMVHETKLISTNHLHVIQMPHDANHYAHDLYHTLRELDEQSFQHILIEAVPHTSEWDAIRDRLNKATAKW